MKNQKKLILILNLIFFKTNQMEKNIVQISINYGTEELVCQ